MTDYLTKSDPDGSYIGKDANDTVSIYATVTVQSAGVLNIASGGALKIAGTQVNASAAEINALVGSSLTTTSTTKLQAITATATEINSLVGSGLTTTSTAKLQAIVPTATALNLFMAAVTAGQKVARGVAAVTTSLEVASGLATVVAAGASLKDDPDITASSVTVAASTTAGNILLKTWQPTATNNVTPAAATKTNVNVSWWAVGT